MHTVWYLLQGVVPTYEACPQLFCQGHTVYRIQLVRGAATCHTQVWDKRGGGQWGPHYYFDRQKCPILVFLHGFHYKGLCQLMLTYDHCSTRQCPFFSVATAGTCEAVLSEVNQIPRLIFSCIFIFSLNQGSLICPSDTFLTLLSPPIIYHCMLPPCGRKALPPPCTTAGI